MIQQSIFHEIKSRYCYMFDRDTLHLRIRVARDQAMGLQVVGWDPYHWKPDPMASASWALDRDRFIYNEMEKEHSDDYFDYWFVEITQPSLRLRYGFLVSSNQGDFFYGAKGVISKDEYLSFDYEAACSSIMPYFFHYPFFNQADSYSAPAWAQETIWYQIFPNYFKNGDPSLNDANTLEWGDQTNETQFSNFGGDLAGIISKLDYIKDLGFNGIYFNSLFKSESSHKYNVEDYYQIDPQYGSKADFKRLVEEAHARGIKIMLDGVFNHCGWKHPYWQDVVKHGSKSPYFDWFVIEREPVVNFDPIKVDQTNLTYEVMNNLNYHTFALNPFTPKWNDANPEARAYLINSAKYWTEEFGVDAWRMDVSIEISHDFWREVRRTLQGVNPQVYIIGENWDRSYPWLRDNQFDGMMNFEVTYNILEFIGEQYLHQKKSAVQFIKNLHDYLVYYPKNMLPNMFNIADTQDTERIISFCENDIRKAKLIYALHMFMPGAPCIYYGSEVGLTGVTPYDGRKCMPWSPDPKTHELHGFLKQFIALRKDNPAMAGLEFEWLEINESHDAFILRKQVEGNCVYLLLNNSNNEIVFNSTVLSIGERTIGPYGFAVLPKSEESNQVGSKN